jgi:hypothetical protein
MRELRCTGMRRGGVARHCGGGGARCYGGTSWRRDAVVGAWACSNMTRGRGCGGTTRRRGWRLSAATTGQGRTGSKVGAASTAVTNRRSANLSGVASPAAATVPSIRARAAPPSSTLGLPKRAAVASPSTMGRKLELACLTATTTFLYSIRGESSSTQSGSVSASLPTPLWPAAAAGGASSPLLFHPPPFLLHAPSAGCKCDLLSPLEMGVFQGDAKYCSREAKVNLPSNFALPCLDSVLAKVVRCNHLQIF